MTELYSAFINCLYPKKKYCLLCGSRDSRLLCKNCASTIEFIQERKCLKCGKGLLDEYDENICTDCKESSFTFHSAYSSFYYRGTGKKLIHKLKYEGKKEIAKILADYIFDIVRKENLKADIIVPVPLHKNKLEMRGFNQSYIIGEYLSKYMDSPIQPSLVRKKDTKAQYNFDKLVRKLNVSNAFSMDLLYNVINKRILLVDDVFTTGNTVEECSKVLKKSGAADIYVVTAASGINT